MKSNINYNLFVRPTLSWSLACDENAQKSRSMALKLLDDTADLASQHPLNDLQTARQAACAVLVLSLLLLLLGMILVYSSITSTKKKHSIILILFLVANLIILVIPAILVKSALGSAFVITEGWYTRLQSL